MVQNEENYILIRLPGPDLNIVVMLLGIEINPIKLSLVVSTTAVIYS